MQNQMNQQAIGAHEILDCHEVLMCTINGINQFQLFQQYCQDQELKNILQNQLSFMTSEYNTILQAVQQKANIGQLPSVKANMNFTPSYGIKQGGVPEIPNASVNHMNDRDVSSCMLGLHKSSAVMKMQAALECTDSGLREMMIQSAKNCADQAYEVWSYMNKNGYYQVPTFDQTTTNAIMNSYQPSSIYNPTAQQISQNNIHF
ncbi:spore coat protein [Metabacillus niabensis]|uniref:Spore coat protein CotF n=1 Tax=Metabacillus niabensis TaxID=324854 RepID=A0ABT9Z646_9BACI|nr:spore coat protein [Metabacillus niabensis]MDQ0227434.1 spore coat protein CotF [Metabacillus niabensis]